MMHNPIDEEGFRRFFAVATGFREPYPWQVSVAKEILGMKRGILFLSAETGAGKTEAVAVPALYRARQLIVVEPFRALVEDMVDRFRKMLGRLSRALHTPYTLGLDYGGDHIVYEITEAGERQVVTRKPFGVDVLVTTMDEMLYRLLSVGSKRKASLYATLVRLGTPIVFFDEAHSYSTEVMNPLITVLHEALSISLYSPVVIASATLPEQLRSHIKLLAERNRVPIKELAAPPREKKTHKARLELRLDDGREKITVHAVKLLAERFRTVLVRTITPETAYSVYRELLKWRGIFSDYSIGILHGRMPVRDRAEVFRVVKEDMESGKKVVLVATPVIEAGVDLDFDAGVLELTPYRSLEQTLGRINRHYTKPDAKVVVVGVDEATWGILAPREYLDEVRSVLKAVGGECLWGNVRWKLKKIDEKYVGDQLSAPSLLDAYDSPYSKLLAVSFHSLFHLEGTMMEYLLALSKESYNTRGSFDITVYVEGEPGNYLRIPFKTAEKLSEKGIIVEPGGTIPQSLLTSHDYIGAEGTVKARGLVV